MFKRGLGSNWVGITVVAVLGFSISVSALQDRSQSNNQQTGTRSAGVKPKRPTQSKPKGRPGLKSTSSTNAASEGLSPVLATADFDLTGLAVTAGPATLTVPKNTPTFIQTSVNAPVGTDPAAIIAELNPNYRVRGELTGPSLTSPLTLEAPIGQPLNIPGLNNAGDHLVRNLRVVDVGTPDQAVVTSVTPDFVGIVVIERLLISQVEVHELSYDQIIQAGINITDDSYKAFNFTLGVATTSEAQTITIPVAFPSVGVTDPRPLVGIPSISGPGIDPPTVAPVMLTIEGPDGEPSGQPPSAGDGPMRIPGVVVFPGRVGFLHQFFEAIVIVANGAPNGAPLVLHALKAKAHLPDNGTPADAADDPLRIAETQTGGRVDQLELHGLGPDGRYGTADDITSFGPAGSGQASFLIEGLKEGLHAVDFDLEAMLEGLPSGPVKVRGQVSGAVLVRDASFAVTFTHPSVVRAGNNYDLGMTIYNSGQTDIQGAFAQLAPNSISGANLIGQDTGRRQFATTIRRGESATVKWRLHSNTTGEVTASYVKVGEGVSAGLALVAGVGDRNIPLSPDSLILPDPVKHLPSGVVEAGRALLGQGWSIANAPPGSLPQGVKSVTKQTVVNRAVELGIAGMRVDFGEPVSVSLDTVLRDWLGELQSTPDPGFADAQRNTQSGFDWFDSIGAEFYKRLNGANPVTAFDLHQEFANTEVPRSRFISALVTQAPGEPVVGARFVDSNGKQVGFGASEDDRTGDLVQGSSQRLLQTDVLTGAVTNGGEMLLVSNASTDNWTLELSGWRTGMADLSLLAATNSVSYGQFVWSGIPITQGGKYRVRFKPLSLSSAPVLEELVTGTWQAMNVAASVTTLNQPAPRVVGVIQVTPEVVPGGDKYGRLLGVLFSKPMLQDQAQTASRYRIGGGALKGSNPAQQVGDPIGVTGARMDYGNRFVFISLNSTIGPYINRDLTITNLQDARHMPLSPTPSVTAIEPRVSPQGIPPGAYLTGRVLNGNGTPVNHAPVIVWVLECPDPRMPIPPEPTPIALKYTDEQGRYEIDYVRDGDCGPMNVSVTNPTTHSEKRFNSAVAYDGQHMVLDMVFLARGNVEGNITSGGHSMPNAFVRVVPDLDVVGTKVVQADLNGHYVATDIPVGNVSVLAVGAGDAHNASGFAAGTIEGPNQTAFINVSLQNIAGVVQGRVYRYDQTPSAGALVVAYAVIPGFHSTRGDGATPVGYAFADRDGSFTISSLPVSDIKLEVTDYVTGLITQNSVQLTTAIPEVHGILITLPGPGSVTGRVTDDLGVGLANIYVSSAGRAVLTNSLGNYTLPNLPAGSQTISAYDPVLGRSGSVSGVVVHVNQTTSGADIVMLRPSSLNGTVYVINEGTSNPVPVAGVKVTANGYNIYDTDAQGHYSIPNVQPGPTLLRFVDLSKNNAINTNVVLAPGETLTRDATFRPGKIHGKIYQPDGVTPTLAQVSIYTPRAFLFPGAGWGSLASDEPLTAQSAADGSYSVSGLNPGVYRVTTSSVFFPTPVNSGGTLAPGGDDEVNLTLVSTLAGKIQGRIYQPDGTTPVGPGIQVTLGGGSLANATVRTDETGHYEFGEVFSAGTYTLVATDPSVGNTNRLVVSIQKNKDAVFNMRLLGAGSLRVRVIDGGGNPVNSGSVTLDGSAYPNAHRFAEITPDANGIVVFDNLPEGPYAIAGSRLGLGGRSAVSVPRNATVETTILLQASGTVEGRVFMPGGITPVGLADVQLTAAGRSIGFTVTSDVDPDKGKFSFLNVPAGDFTLDVLDNRTGRVGRSAGHITAQGEVATVNVQLLVIGAVAGRVTANGQPVDHALVEINSDGSGVRGAHLSATTDPDGHYRFTGIPAGRFYINVSDAPGGQTGSATGTISGTVEPLPDQIVDIALAPSQTVTGTIYRFGGTEPVPGAVVTVNGQRVVTTDQGVYRLSFVPLGEVRVRAESPAGNDRGEAAPVTGTVAGGTVIINVTLAGMGNVTGLATDNSGNPLNIGYVTLTNDEWGTPVELVAPVRADGTYEITGAFAGEFTLRLTVPGNVGVGTASGTVVANQTTNLNIHLEDAGRLTGRVKSEDGTAFVPGADVNITLWRDSGALFFFTHTNSAGEWSVTNVPLGSATVRVFDPVTESAARTGAMSLTANGQVLDFGEMRLRHNKWGVVEGTVQNGNSQPFAGATVTITAPNGTFTAITGANGQYHFEPIDVGSFTVQATEDVNGFLDRRSGQIVQDEQVSHVSLRLIARGTLTGTVTRHDGTTVVAGAQVVVRQSTFFGSQAVGSAMTDAQGHFSIELIPTGQLFLDVTDPATGDRARIDTSLGANLEVKNLDVSLRGLGNVVVTVTNLAGTRIEGAHVTITTPYPLETSATETTQFDGTASFENVLGGNYQISVHDPATGLNGSASGALTPDTTANVTVQLEASGTISGRVLAPDGTTPAVGMTVRIFDGRQVVSGPGGLYSFEHLTLGQYQLSVLDQTGHLRARADASQITAEGEVVTQDFVMEAVGTITGRVIYANGATVPGASVSLRVNNPTLGQALDTAVWADGNGAFRFDNVVVGDYALSTYDPQSGLAGSTSGSISAGETVNVDLQLEDAGRIVGHVFAADGVTPVAGATVVLAFSDRQMVTGADGAYHFDGVPFQYTNVAAYKPEGTLRAFSGWFEVAHGQGQVTVDLTLAGLGTITGRVLNEDGTPPPHLTVYLNALDAPVYNPITPGETDDAGFYRFENVIVGTYEAVVDDATLRVYGRVEVTLADDGGTATAPDIHLFSNPIYFPVTYHDGNSFEFDITSSGSTDIGQNYMYVGDGYAHRGGFNLDVIAEGVPYSFAGSYVGSGEENDREVVTRQQNLAGLNVTRKVYLPRDGYFVRHLELFQNPTASPITVSVRVQTNIRPCAFWYYYGCQVPIISTSSGDDGLDVSDASNPDRWMIVDDYNDGDPIQLGDLPASAYAFDGSGAAERVASLTTLTVPGARQLSYQWDNVTIQPGATVGYLHFGVVQTSRAAAQSSVERLVQLPPEAMAGLSAEERSEVRNFAIPADGSSTLAALPSLGGNVSGRVLSGDNETGVGGGTVEFKSNNIYFNRTLRATAGADGSFAFLSRQGDSTEPLLSLDAFTLHTNHPQIYYQQLDTTGSFPAGETSVTQNLVFENTGNITGVVRRANGTPITTGVIDVQSPQTGIFVSVVISGDGTYSMKGFPAGEYTLRAIAQHPQGAAIVGTTIVTLAAGQSVNADITLPATGTITGTVHKADGTNASNVFIHLNDGNYTYYRTTVTNSSGHYTLTEVPVGDYEVLATEPNTGTDNGVPVTVVANQTATADITLNGIGNIQVTVTYADGTPAANALVQAKYGSYPYFRWVGPTDAQGVITINSVPTGPFTVSASNPNNQHLTSEASGNLVTNGATEPITVALAATGIVRGHVTFGDGSPAANAPITLAWPNSSSGGYELNAQTNSNGDYIFPSVEVGRGFTLRARHPSNDAIRQNVGGQIVTSAGQTLVIDVSFPATATLRVTALRADDTPFAYSYIYLTNPANNAGGYDERYVGSTDGNGVLLVPGVPVGNFGLFVFDFGIYGIVGSASGTIQPSDVGQTVDITIREGFKGNVQGRVLFGGEPQPYVNVEIRDLANGRGIGYTQTDEQGSYRFDNVLAGREGFRVIAQAPWDGNQTGEATGAFVNNGDTITLDVTLPGAKISGHVFYADGVTPVAYASVWASQQDENGDVRVHYSSTEEDGSYTMMGVREGDFDLYAQPQNTPLTGKVSGSVTAGSGNITLNVVLPPSGKIRGTVRDAAGQPVAAGTYVWLTQGQSPSVFEALTDEQGAFQFDWVNLGNFYLQSRDDLTGGFGAAGGSLRNNGETVTADINFPATTTVSGHIFRADGTTPVANAPVYIENFSNGGGVGRYSATVTANALGNYSATGVPLGLVRVTAGRPSDSTQVGEAETTLASTDAATVNVTLGNVVNLDNRRDLIGADHFRYQFYSDGDIDSGGTADDRLLFAYNGAYNLTFQDESWRYFNHVEGSDYHTAAVEDGGREYAFGYDNQFGLLLKRKLFVPEAGGFARYLEIIKNPTTKPITVQAGVDSWFGYVDNYYGNNTLFNVLVSPAQTSNTYAVTEFKDSCCHPMLGHVFAGPNARWPLSDVKVWNENNNESRSIYRWNVTVAPGQTIIFMHFTAQHEPADVAGTEAQATALVNLSDPHALDGMSEEEKSEVVNFRIGAASATTGKVTVQVNYDSGSPAPGVSVYIREAAHGDATREAGRTDAQGRLTINHVQAGAFTVRAYSPATASVFVEAAGTIAGGDVVPVTLTLPAVGTVTGRVTNPNQRPIAHATVELIGPDLATVTAETDAIGNYAFVSVPMGHAFTVKVTRPDDANIHSISATQTIATPGQRLTLDFVMPMWTWVFGHVYGGDGQTPVPYANVEVLDPTTGESLEGHTYQASDEGLFVTGYLLVGRQGVRVRATRSFGSDFLAEVSATVPIDDVAIGNANVTLPIPVVKGVITRSDGESTPFPVVYLLQNDANGVQQRIWTPITGADGTYAAFGLGTGNFTLEAEDQQGTRGAAAGTFADLATAVQLNVALPATATVSGTVFDSTGARVPNADLAITSSGRIFDRFATADAQGNYTVTGVTPGSIFVQAQHPATTVSALGYGSVAPEASVSINVNLPATGTLSGTVFRADGTTPLANATVKIENFAGAGGNGHFVVSAVTDASGNYAATDVQVGTVRVTAKDPGDATVLGTMQAVVSANASAPANVSLGNVFGINNIPFNLDGADGFRYDIWNDGGLNAGGTADGRLADAYSGSHNLTVDDNWYYWNRITLASLEDSGREIVIGADSWGGLFMTRKVFVPSGGGFARFLEIISNPTDRPLTYRMGIDGWTGFGNDTRVHTAPGDTGNTYAVLFDNTNARPALAEAFAGPGAAVPASSTDFGSNLQFSYHWNVTLQPGQTVVLMHFAVQREPSDTAGARAQAESLATLSDSHALEGMSEAERGQVINFQIPSQAGVRNEIRNHTTTRKSDAAQPRRDSSRAAVAASGGSAATKGDGQASGVRSNRAGRQGFQKR